MSARWDLYGVEPDLWLMGPEGTDEERFIAKINLPADASPALRARRFAEARLMKAAPVLAIALEQLLTASYAHGPSAVTEAREAREAARAALRAAAARRDTPPADVQR